MNKKIFDNKIIIYIFFTIIAFIIRYYLFEGRNSWHDEWHSIYVANPFVSNSETLIKYFGDKGDSRLTEFYPPLYIFILKYFFLIFGYFDDNGRLFSLIIGTLVVPLSIYLSDILIFKKKIFFTGFIVTFNLFLIWQSLEIRAHSLLVFSSLINIILFYKILEHKKIIYLVLYFLTSIFLLSLWPIAGAIFFGKTIYLIKNYLIKKKFEGLIFILFTLILLIYIYLNIDYLKLNIGRDSHYTTLYSSFFYNYHFKTFFGSTILGFFYLITFAFLFTKNIKKIIFQNTKENLIIYIILSSYFLTLSYTLLRASIMSPKYVIFILPLIIVWINFELIKIKKNKIISTFLTLITVIFCITEINNFPIKRPPTNEALSIIKNDGSKYIITIEKDVYNNYLHTKKKFVENKFILIDNNIKIPNHVSPIWFICLNNTRFAIGNKKLPDQKRCTDFKINNFNKIKEVKLKDYILIKFKNSSK